MGRESLIQRKIIFASVITSAYTETQNGTKIDNFHKLIGANAMITLDNIQTDLWSLHADLTENNLQRDEVKDRIHIIVNNLEKLIALHGLWERGLPESIPHDLASWYTGTVYCSIEHPVYGKHKVTPRQIKYSSGEYQSKLFKDMIKTAIDYAVNHDDRKLADKIIEATNANQKRS